MLLYSDPRGYCDIFFLPAIVTQIGLDLLKDILRSLEKFHYSFMLLGEFLASNSLHDLGGQKNELMLQKK